VGGVDLQPHVDLGDNVDLDVINSVEVMKPIGRLV